MSTIDAGLALWLEAGAVAIGFAALAIRPRAAWLVAALIGHGLVGLVAWTIAGGPGELGSWLAVRTLLAGEGLVAWSLAACLGRAGVERGVAAAIAGVTVLAVVAAPATAEPLARMSGQPDVRTVALAASPPFAAGLAIGLDLLHEPALYGRAPAAVMENHMTSWIWTAGAFWAAGLLLAAMALMGGRRRAAAVASLATLVALAVAGCKKEEPAKTEPKAAPQAKPKDTPAEPAKPATPTVAPEAVQAALDKGIEYLAGARAPDGLIGGHPGTTALALLAMVSAPGGPKADDPRVAPTIAALAKLAKKDGAIFDKDYPVYVTAITAMAFKAAAVHPEVVEKAQAWLADKQFDEDHKVDVKNPNYGGVGYGTDQKQPDADLSNLHFALAALEDATLKDRDAVLERARKFVERCQNRTESNDQAWAKDDGGFVYKPGASKAGETTSSASMTYAGVTAFLYADVPKDDPRVAAALTWIRDNFSVDENPGLGAKGLFYHHHMMARALSLLGERTLTDADGGTHDWPVEVSAKLISLQKPDGSWAHTDETYWENNPAIATSRAVLALGHARSAMK